MRPDWDSYFLKIAKVVAARATCDRKHVGAVLVSQDHRILATGYNGSQPGDPHCDDDGHLMIGGHCKRTVHAEINAINQAIDRGVRFPGTTLYVTASPCYPCFERAVAAGICRIVFDEFYRDERVIKEAADWGIELVQCQVSP